MEIEKAQEVVQGLKEAGINFAVGLAGLSVPRSL